MKKKSLTKLMAVVAVLLVSTSAFAQNGRFSFGVDIAMPMGDFGDNAGTGFGASLRYEMPVGDNLGLTGTVTYLTFGKKTEDFGFAKAEYTSSMIPIMVGGKYYFTEQQSGFYAGLQLGVTMFTSKVEIPAYTIGSVTVPAYSSSDNTSAFTYAPGIGYHLDNLDFSVGYYAFSYESSTTVNGITVTSDASGSWLGIRLAYVFGEK